MAQAHAKRLGAYMLLRRLGVGGMAETFVARRRHGAIEQLVCLKRVLPAFAEDPEFVRQFQREARIAGTLRHENIVGVLDFGVDAGEHYLALELIDGVDLRGLLASLPDRRLPAELVALVGLELAQALEYAHQAPAGSGVGVVHRDLSPSNVLLSVHGEVKLADFGVAKAMGGTGATASGVVKGKVAYMAPEHMRGAKDLDGRADLFSLGVLLYECLAGRRPFDGSHDVETMVRVMENDRVPLRELAPAAPPALLEVVEKLLAHDREERVPAAEQVVLALGALTAKRPARQALAERVRAAYGGSAEDSATRDTVLVAPPLEALEADSVSPPPTRAQSSVPPPPPVSLDSTPSSQTPPPREEVTLVTMPAMRSRGPLLALLGVLLAGGLGVGIALLTADESEPAPVSARPAPERAEPASEAAPSPTRKDEDPPRLAPAHAGAMVSRSASSGVTAMQSSATTQSEEPMRPLARPASRPRRVRAAARMQSEAAREQARAGEGQQGEASAAEAQEREAQAGGTTEDSAPVRRGFLRVTAIPYGEVWIDGRYMGTSPITTPVEVGVRLVEVGDGRPMTRRRVRVRSGRRTSVELDLISE